jgi:23S rRNA (cytidine1920-2'-O)/16S rRNA (cytidine1409-2'-O)-methyltransferase
MAGLVLVDEQRVDKPGSRVAVDATLRVKGEHLRYVGRGGVKLEAALAAFAIDPEGQCWLDVGASTGGFTDCLLQHGASRVWALDVGHNQLDYRLRTDPRVVVREGINARTLEPADFPRFDGATIDVSFISLALILGPVAEIVRSGGTVLALVKPQFEVGRGAVGKGGIVRDQRLRDGAVNSVRDKASELGYTVVGVIESPITGAAGNMEYWLALRVGGPFR